MYSLHGINHGPIFKDKTVGDNADDEICTESEKAVDDAEIVGQIDVLAELNVVVSHSDSILELVSNVKALVEDVVSKDPPELLARTGLGLRLCRTSEDAPEFFARALGWWRS